MCQPGHASAWAGSGDSQATQQGGVLVICPVYDSMGSSNGSWIRDVCSMGSVSQRSCIRDVCGMGGQWYMENTFKLIILVLGLTKKEDRPAHDHETGHMYQISGS